VNGICDCGRWQVVDPGNSVVGMKNAVTGVSEWQAVVELHLRNR